MAQIDYFFAPMSPFTYLAGDRLERIAARHGATIRYIPLDAPALFLRRRSFLSTRRRPPTR
jgi:2-hydroxychromene-2-carboxylate isomerase